MVQGNTPGFIRGGDWGSVALCRVVRAALGMLVVARLPQNNPTLKFAVVLGGPHATC